MALKLDNHTYDRQRQSSHVTIGETEFLTITTEDISPSFTVENVIKRDTFLEGADFSFQSKCNCGLLYEQGFEAKNIKELEKRFIEKEKHLRKEFEERLQHELDVLKERFDFVLHNEQVRASCMLREAHRERQEKINALQAQLECKNLSGLMYVICTERKRSKMERMRITQEYTNYIHALHDILHEGQAMILHLSRGYKTAARVDNEWKEKMAKVVREFQNFVHHYLGGSPASHQYLFDMQKLMQIGAPLKQDLTEDPCECEEEEVKPEADTEDEESEWLSKLGDSRPFIVFGDMADLNPPQRRQILKGIKANKTAPKKWKSYLFNNLDLKSNCPNLDTIKDEYPKLEHDMGMCHGQGRGQSTQSTSADGNAASSVLSSRRMTSTNSDLKSHMGSILKIIANSTAAPVAPTAKNNLLAARDSMEIQSSFLLREKSKKLLSNPPSPVATLDIKSIRNSTFQEKDEDQLEIVKGKEPKKAPKNVEEEEVLENIANLGSATTDSIELQQTRSPQATQDLTINYEKVCPMEKCQKLKVDSFTRSLPPYMRISPFMHFEQTFEQYEACSPEQLKILMRCLEEKKNKEKKEAGILNDDPLNEWPVEVGGIATQTYAEKQEPCNCVIPPPNPSLASSEIKIFNTADLLPLKQVLNRITEDLFFDSNIEMKRFKVIGEESEEKVCNEANTDFTKKRLEAIKLILKKHPSLLDLFQNNTQS